MYMLYLYCINVDVPSYLFSKLTCKTVVMVKSSLQKDTQSGTLSKIWPQSSGNILSSHFAPHCQVRFHVLRLLKVYPRVRHTAHLLNTGHLGRWLCQPSVPRFAQNVTWTLIVHMYTQIKGTSTCMYTNCIYIYIRNYIYIDQSMHFKYINVAHACTCIVHIVSVVPGCQ